VCKDDDSLLVQRSRPQTILAKKNAAKGHISSAVPKLGLATSMLPVNILIKIEIVFNGAQSQSLPQRNQ